MLVSKLNETFPQKNEYPNDKAGIKIFASLFRLKIESLTIGQTWNLAWSGGLGRSLLSSEKLGIFGGGTETAWPEAIVDSVGSKNAGAGWELGLVCLHGFHWNWPGGCGCGCG